MYRWTVGITSNQEYSLGLQFLWYPRKPQKVYLISENSDHLAPKIVLRTRKYSFWGFTRDPQEVVLVACGRQKKIAYH
jgi:hypothetical protein